MATGMFSGGAAFGVFPQMQPRRRFQDVEGSANLPVDVIRGRLAGLLGLVPDVLNFMGRSPMPTETFGETQYEPALQMPYGSEYYLKNLPLAPTSRFGEIVGQAGAFVPLNPMPTVRAAVAGAKALGPTAVRIGEGYLQRQGLMPAVVEGESIGMLGGPIKPQAPVSPLGFFSAAEQAAMNLQRGKGTGQSFLNDLMKAPDVKKDELQYTGLDEFLKDKPNVTRQEVTDYLSKNKVDVEEVQFSDKAASPVSTENITNYFDEAITPNGEPATGIFQFSYGGGGGRDATNFSAYEVRGRGVELYDINGNFIDEYRTLTDARQHVINESEFAATQGEGITKFGRYQLPGGENYREILLTLPNVKGSGLTAQELEKLNALVDKRVGSSLAGLDDIEQKEYFALIKKREESASGYKSSHFDQPNILAHMRVNDRVDADGKKMLLVEEIQSDWHQAGREKGYKTGKERTAVEVERELNIATQKRSRLIDLAAALPDSEMTKFKAMNEEIKKLGQQATKLSEEFTNLLNKPEGVLDAPFKDTWYQLSLKRLMKYAADNGYERVGLTTGTQQAKRYDLGNEVNSINVESVAEVPNLQFVDIDIIGGQRKIALEVENGVVREGEFAGKRLSDIVGKEMADKITNVAKGETKSLAGEDLRIGGEGMKRYYDEIYPKYLEKYGKKFDAKVGETRIKTGRGVPGGEPVRYIDITPKMKEGVSKGQPLFTAAPIGGLGGLLGEDENNEMPDAVRQYMADPRYSDPFVDTTR